MVITEEKVLLSFFRKLRNNPFEIFEFLIVINPTFGVG
jgi:hypothetical protein